MAAADITYSIFHLPELIFRHISNKPEGMSGPGFCFLRNPGIQWIGAFCSALTLVVVAFERYLVVRNPHGNQKVSTEKFKVGIFFSTPFKGRENLETRGAVNYFIHGLIISETKFTH